MNGERPAGPGAASQTPRATIREVTPPRIQRQTPPRREDPRPAPRPAAGRRDASGRGAVRTTPFAAGGPAGRPVPSARTRSVLSQERASFAYAFAGIRYAWDTQRHLRIHVALGLLAIGLGLGLVISPPEWAALLTAITLVLALEMLNTVIESVVDLATSEVHPLAKAAKDVAAGTVLIAAIGAILVGAAIFIPRLAALVVR